MKSFACQICDNHKNNRVHIVREMMFGFRDQFEYMECSKCGCFQLMNPPDDIKKYYPEEFGAFRKIEEYEEDFLKSKFRKVKARYCLNSQGVIGALLIIMIGQPRAEVFGAPDPYVWFRKCEIDFNSDILEVGCGTGKFLVRLRKDGFKFLTGIDPYIKESIFYKSGVKIFKGSIYDIDQQFDFIMMNHCFEHMSDPLSVLKKLYGLLKNHRYVIIRIPVMGSFAWRKYGTNWAQIDAPRHLFLHTIKSMKILASQAGFKLCAIDFDSTDFQFFASERYIKDIPLVEKNNSIAFSKIRKVFFKIKARRLNKNNDGDMACFYLKKDLEL